MRCSRPVSLFLLFLWLFTATVWGESISFAARVLRVSDGDTIQIAVHGTKQKEKVRLYGIDAPETKQPYGAEARTALNKLINGKMVRIEQENRDMYGRIVGRVFFDGDDINLTMLQLGYAWHYKQYCNDSRYATAEKNARNKRLGLWHDKSPQPPWEFRKQKRNKQNTGNQPASGKSKASSSKSRSKK